MRISKIISATILATAIFVLPVTSPAADDDQVRAIMEKAVDEVIKPAYLTFQERSDRMDNAMAALCKEGTANGLARSREAFDALAMAWSKAEVLRDGPVIEDNRFERIYFFPDRKSIGLKQIQALLAKKDEEAILPETMPQKSVALQGLGALEFVLYGTGSEKLESTADTYRCRAGLAVAENVAMLANELVTTWDDPEGIQKDWKSFGPDNAYFRDSDEAISGLLGILVRGVETIRDKRLKAFYVPGEDNPNPNPRKAALWRSENTMRSLAANLEGLQAYWLETGMQDVIEGDASAITTNITFNFKTAIETAKSFDMPVADILEDEKLRGKLAFLALTIDDLLNRLNNDYGAAMGLGTSFTFSDGD